MTEPARLSSLRAMLKAEVACFRAKGAVRRQGLALVGGEGSTLDSVGRTGGVQLSYGFDGTRLRNSSSQFSTSTSS